MLQPLAYSLSDGKEPEYQMAPQDYKNKLIILCLDFIKRVPHSAIQCSYSRLNPQILVVLDWCTSSLNCTVRQGFCLRSQAKRTYNLILGENLQRWTWPTPVDKKSDFDQCSVSEKQDKTSHSKLQAILLPALSKIFSEFVFHIFAITQLLDCSEEWQASSASWEEISQAVDKMQSHKNS